MRESLDLPNMPEYVPIKEAAKMLGVSDKRVYAYIEEGRLPAVRAAHVIMIPVEEVRKFQPKISGRPRKNTPAWRTSPEDNLLLTTSIFVQVKANQQKKLQQKLEEIKQTEDYIFPGTVARYIIRSKTHTERLEILLIWRSTTMPDEAARKQAFNQFQQTLEDVIDWSSVHYIEGEAILHT
ncbi:MAG TPA: helix-turn-helix domain-containing protein [Methylomirabilota bacterium]|nr:helix-turn-helix domain-containing protein [Methylomirabilota bacterium]